MEKVIVQMMVINHFALEKQDNKSIGIGEKKVIVQEGKGRKDKKSYRRILKMT